MTTVQLATPADLAGFRRAARRLVAQGVAPGQVAWRTDGDTGPVIPNLDLFPAEATSGPDARDVERTPPALRVPPAYAHLCDSIVLHRDPQRFDLMYRLLWRLCTDRATGIDPLHPDWRRAEHLARDVRRDIHKMRAFVRFTPVDDAQGTRHIAWFEPDHHIVEANASFFARRFAQMRWAIVTPERSVAWDGAQLAFGPGGDRRDTPRPDAGAQLWLTYYQHIFNPARLKLAMMTKEMPRRYWRNLPEAALIAPLAAAAAARSEAMVQAEPTRPRRIKPMARPGGAA